MLAIEFLLAPLTYLVRLIRFVFKVAFYTLFICVIFLTNNAGWIVGIGTNGYLSRQWQIERATERTDTPKPFKVDFSAIDMTENSDGERRYFIHSETDTDFDSCGAGLKEQDITSNMGVNIFFRSKSSFHRKSARLSRAFIVAGVAATRLRTVLARMKANQPVGNDDEALYCGAATRYDENYQPKVGYDNLKGIPGVTNIKLSHAPSVIVQTGSLLVSEHSDQIQAICLASYGSCRPKATFYMDLFTTPLPSEQEDAEQAMLTMGTEEFWKPLHMRTVSITGMRMYVVS